MVGTERVTGDPERAAYTDAFSGETLDPAHDVVLRVVVSRMNGGNGRQEFYVRRERFIAALHQLIPLGEVFDDE